MGNSSSHTHEPLERGFQRGKYGDVQNGKTSSFRLSKKSPKKMDRLRRSFRDSFRRRKVPESSKPHQWQADEEAVRSATCSFAVKYLGCVEVFESRGMQVCEEALKVLRNSRRRPVRGLLHVSGDGLRVVDDETKGLIVDQTIEKVSFCAPDRNHERGFSYICRDGTTRRWMCHGFLASRDSGERLSHAVGCAFAVCLERKQRRDKECGVTMTFDVKNSTFTRTGSFRQQTLTERLANNERGIDAPTAAAIVAPQPKPFNPFAIERPHATPSMLERQGSFRAFSTIGSQSPFKRQMSLRINDLPSNAERQKAFFAAATSGTLALATPNRSVSPIPEVSPAKSNVDIEKSNTPGVDTVSQLCQELSQGLSLLSQTDAGLGGVGDDLNFNNSLSINQNYMAIDKQRQKSPTSNLVNSSYNYISDSNSSVSTAVITTTPIAQKISNIGFNAKESLSPESRTPTTPTFSVTLPTSPSAAAAPTPVAAVTGIVNRPIEIVAPLPNADQWLGEVVKSTSPAAIKRSQLQNASKTKIEPLKTSSSTDPFDAEWATNVTKSTSAEIAGPSTNVQHPYSTNPFISPSKVQPPPNSFQLQL